MFTLAHFIKPNEPIKPANGSSGGSRFDVVHSGGEQQVQQGSAVVATMPPLLSFCGSTFENHDIGVAPPKRFRKSPPTNPLMVQPITSSLLSQQPDDASSSSSSGGMSPDAMLAKELTRLSMEEREEVFADLHGVADVVQETPTMLDRAFQELEKEIQKNKRRPAYEKALFLDPRYVQSKEFRIKFLGADRFNIKAAAKRLVQHFEFKMELFGYDKLARDITFEDLNVQDQQDCLHGGYWFLPSPNQADRSGRRIQVMTLEQIYKLDSTHTELLWYLYMNALEDANTQRYGIVQVMYCMGSAEIERNKMKKPAFNVEIIAKSSRLFSCLPFRLVALHVCLDDQTAKPPFFNIFQMAVEMNYRFRFRMHSGSPVEIQYELGSYGIPTYAMPFDVNGRFSLDVYQRELKERIALEEQRKLALKNSGRIDHPSSYDVLLGRGRPYQEFPGNIHLAALVEQNQHAYETGERNEKQVLAKFVTDQILEKGGRFLKRPENYETSSTTKPDDTTSSSCDATMNGGVDSNTSAICYCAWELVDDETIKVKIGNSFRTKRKLEKRKEAQGMKRKGSISS